MRKEETSNGKQGGLFKGKTHADGGIKAIVVDTNQPIEVEKDEVIITAPAVRDKKFRNYSGTNAEILSKINQSGGGVEIPSPNQYKYGGPIVQFNRNNVPNTAIIKFGHRIKKDMPEIWANHGTSFENNLFNVLAKVSDRGHWLPAEKDQYQVWQMYCFNHKSTNTVDGIVGLIKCGGKSTKGYAHMKQVIEQLHTGTKVEKKEHSKTIKKLQGKKKYTVSEGSEMISADHINENTDQKYYDKLSAANLKTGGPIPAFDQSKFIDYINGQCVSQFGSKLDSTDLIYSYDKTTNSIYPFDAVLESGQPITIEMVNGYITISELKAPKLALGGSTATDSEYSKAVSDLDKAEKLQKMMKDTNAIIRSKKNVTERLIKEAGLSEAVAKTIQEPDRYNRTGFPGYRLTNNNASIKRLKDRVNMLTKKLAGATKSAETGEVESYEFEGGTIEVNYEIDRVQILFPGGRVEKDLYRQLRSNGWVYSPTNTAFQRKITPQAISNAVYMFKAKKVGSSSAAPTQSKELSVSEYSEMIENRNFSYVSIYMHDALPSGYSGDQYFTIVYFDLISPVIKEGVKKYLSENIPGIDTEKIKLNIYPKTYIRESKQLFSQGRFLPSSAGPEIVLGPSSLKLKEYLSNPPAESEIEEPIVAPPISTKKYLRLNRYFNGIPEDTIVEVVEAPNMFVKRIKFGDETFTVDNSYLSKVEKEVKLMYPKLPHNHPLNILDPKSSQFKEALKEEEEKFGATEKTLGETSGGWIVEYADEKGKIISELESQGEMTTSDAQGILQANESFAKDQYGLGISPSKIAEKILAKGEKPKPRTTEIPPATYDLRTHKGIGTTNAKKIKSTPFESLNKEYQRVEQMMELSLNDEVEYRKLSQKLEEIQSEMTKIATALENTETTSEVGEPTFQGINYPYKNQYVLNKAIESFLSTKAFDYTSDEKNFIKKYSGYGGLSKYGASSEDQRGGTSFEFYTPKEVVEKMWGLAYKHGYNDGSILEPSIGTGEFLQFAPKDSRVVGYEINSNSAQICKILYPTTEVFLQPFEQTFIKNNFTVKDKTDHLEKFDLVIGNPPYGSFDIVKSRWMSMGEKDHVKPQNYVEYFLRRSLDLLKPNGLLIFIIGAQIKNGGTMFLDSGETPVKKYLADNCELLEAYRLPDSVFERTSVTADIIVLRKK